MHERWHYDLGCVLARSAIRRIQALRVADGWELNEQAVEIIHHHLDDHRSALTGAYDLATGHGGKTQNQKQWSTVMQRCMTDNNATKLMGLAL